MRNPSRTSHNDHSSQLLVGSLDYSSVSHFVFALLLLLLLIFRSCVAFFPLCSRRFSRTKSCEKRTERDETTQFSSNYAVRRIHWPIFFLTTPSIDKRTYRSATIVTLGHGKHSANRTSNDRRVLLSTSLSCTGRSSSIDKEAHWIVNFVDVAVRLLSNRIF